MNAQCLLRVPRFVMFFFTKARSFVMKGFVYAEQFSYMVIGLNFLFGKLFIFPKSLSVIKSTN